MADSSLERWLYMTMQSIIFVVLVCAAGNMVDVFDLAIFSRVRLQSLKELGVVGDQAVGIGALLFNLQLFGLFLGALFWGAVTDLRGRSVALFGSIGLYSAATLMNSMVGSIGQYAALRFVAGFGLAGEIGAAITVIVQVLPMRYIPLGSMVIAFAGFVGSLLASLSGEYLHWRTAYLVGGGLGLVVLLSRLHPGSRAIFDESSGYSHSLKSWITGLRTRRSLITAILLLLIGIPTWYVSSVLVQFSPEIAAAQGIRERVSTNFTAIAWAVGNLAGDLLCGGITFLTQARRQTLTGFLAAGLVSISLLISPIAPPQSAQSFYTCSFIVGASMGYWAVYLGVVATSFPPEIRGGAASLIPNLVRFAAVPVTIAFAFLNKSSGALKAAQTVGAVIFLFAIIAVLNLPSPHTERTHQI